MGNSVELNVFQSEVLSVTVAWTVGANRPSTSSPQLSLSQGSDAQIGSPMKQGPHLKPRIHQTALSRIGE